MMSASRRHSASPEKVAGGGETLAALVPAVWRMHPAWTESRGRVWRKESLTHVSLAALQQS
jgi:hypothetical protein